MRSDARSRAVRTASLAGRSEVYSSRSLRPNLSEAVNAWIASPWSTASCCGLHGGSNPPEAAAHWTDDLAGLLSAVIPARCSPPVSIRTWKPRNAPACRRRPQAFGVWPHRYWKRCRRPLSDDTLLGVDDLCQRLCRRTAPEIPDAERRAAAPCSGSPVVLVDGSPPGAARSAGDATPECRRPRHCGGRPFYDPQGCRFSQ